MSALDHVTFQSEIVELPHSQFNDKTVAYFAVRHRIFDSCMAEVTRKSAALFEERVRLAIRPAPWYIPEGAWRWVAAHLLEAYTERR